MAKQQISNHILLKGSEKRPSAVSSLHGMRKYSVVCENIQRPLDKSEKVCNTIVNYYNIYVKQVISVKHMIRRSSWCGRLDVLKRASDVAVE
jgi:hypothetical protein